MNYDVIAHLYHGQPYRRKTVDPELVIFTAQHASPDRLSLLDIACGTGSQLVENRLILPDARLVGLDRSFGMLNQARSKVSDIAWVRADSAKLSFRAESFDLISCDAGDQLCRDLGCARTHTVRAGFARLAGHGTATRFEFPTFSYLRPYL